MDKKYKEMCNIPDNILELLQKDVAEIKLALLGNEYNPNSGIGYRMSKAELEYEKLRARMDRIIWTATGAATALTLIGNIVIYWFEKVVLK